MDHCEGMDSPSRSPLECALGRGCNGSQHGSGRSTRSDQANCWTVVMRERPMDQDRSDHRQRNDGIEVDMELPNAPDSRCPEKAQADLGETGEALWGLS